MATRESKEEVREKNAKLDAELCSEGMVDQALFLRLLDGYSYDAASTVSWVIARLKVLRQKIERGEPLSLFSPTSQAQVVVLDETAFLTWVEKNFPGMTGISLWR